MYNWKICSKWRTISAAGLVSLLLVACDKTIVPISDIVYDELPPMQLCDLPQSLPFEVYEITHTEAIIGIDRHGMTIIDYNDKVKAQALVSCNERIELENKRRLELIKRNKS